MNEDDADVENIITDTNVKLKVLKLPRIWNTFCHLVTKVIKI